MVAAPMFSRRRYWNGLILLRHSCFKSDCTSHRSYINTPLFTHSKVRIIMNLQTHFPFPEATMESSIGSRRKKLTLVKFAPSFRCSPAPPSALPRAAPPLWSLAAASMPHVPGSPRPTTTPRARTPTCPSTPRPSTLVCASGATSPQALGCLSALPVCRTRSLIPSACFYSHVAIWGFRYSYEM